MRKGPSPEFSSRARVHELEMVRVTTMVSYALDSPWAKSEESRRILPSHQSEVILWIPSSDNCWSEPGTAQGRVRAPLKVTDTGSWAFQDSGRNLSMESRAVPVTVALDFCWAKVGSVWPMGTKFPPLYCVLAERSRRSEKLTCPAARRALPNARWGVLRRRSSIQISPEATSDTALAAVRGLARTQNRIQLTWETVGSPKTLTESCASRRPMGEEIASLKKESTFRFFWRRRVLRSVRVLSGIRIWLSFQFACMAAVRACVVWSWHPAVWSPIGQVAGTGSKEYS